MNRPEPLQPAYDFSSAPEPVSLLQRTAEVGFNNYKFSGTADLQLRFLPSPCLVFHAHVQGKREGGRPLFWNPPKDISFSFNRQRIEGFHGKHESDAEAEKLDWHSEFEPVELDGMHPETSVAAILHLFNFPNFRGGQHQATAAPAGCALLVLESEEWRISLQSLPDNATHQAWKRIKDEGGCFLTHLMKMERKDGEPFSGEDASEQCHLLENFLSFIKGGKCAPVCGVGLDAAGATTWKTFASPHAGKPPYSWFNPFKASQAELLFPLFAKRWQQHSGEWKDCLRTAIYWYTQANTSGGSPSIDAAIILAQSALERLAHHHLVVDKKMISPEGLDRLKTSDRLRLLFSSLGIPVEISAATPEVQKAASNFKWLDAPHAMTDIRNELVHPVSKKQVASCFFEAWKLSLWYLELSVLALCGYDDTYVNRLTATYVTDSENVPWGKKA